MPVPSTINDLSATPGSNGPVGSTESPASLDDYLRAHAAFIAQLRDGKPSNTGTGASGTWNISVSGNAATATTATNATNATNADLLDGIDSSGFTRTTGFSSLGSFAQTSGNSSGGFSGIVEANNAASGFGTATAFDARLHGVLVGGVHFTDMGDGGCEVSLDYTPPGDPNTDRRVFGGLKVRTDGIVEAKGFLSNAGVGAIGTYALLKEDNTTTRQPGDTLPGSSLQYSNASGALPNIVNPAGTWRCMGLKWGGGAPSDRVTTWMRIA